MEKDVVQPFNSFFVLYKVLIWAGYFKHMNKPKNKFKWVLHQIYRPLALSYVVVFNLQHIMFIVQRRDNLEDVFDGLMIEVPQLNLVMKIITLNLRIPRIDKINNLIKEPIFGATNQHDAELILQNNDKINRLTKLVLAVISVSSLVWPASHFGRRYQDPTSVVPSYVPFHTDTWGKFSMSVLIEVVPLLWVAFGHISIDLLVAAYYAQAQVQLKIIKHNLVHLFDSDEVCTTNRFQYKDVIDPSLKERFVYFVQRFEKVAWYTREVDKIFNFAMSFQFFTSIITLCIVVCRISSTPGGTVSVAFLFILIFIYSTQVFLYCYFGNLVKYESESMASSLYLSDWVSVSPKFRRMLLIAMLRWSRTLTPTIAGIFPLSLNTFVTILRSAYSLYAVLGTKNSYQKT